MTARLQRVGRRALARLDAWFNALYTWRYNPLYHTGALAVGALAVLLVTGLVLLLFYRIGAPYESVTRITEQRWLGAWMRTLHRYASDLAIAATVVHAVRMFVQGRSWGPRALAWISGLVLTFVLFVCGWTGYVMVWDQQAQILAVEGARLLDLIPLFSEPITRTFVGDAPPPPAFFFLNLFAHVAFPVGVALLLWLHVSRLARTYLMPPKPLFWGTVALLGVPSLLWPITMGPEADLLTVPDVVGLDVFYNFWLPWARDFGPGWTWAGFLAVAALGLAVPALQRPPKTALPRPSVVAERSCTGCEQCYHDCPYEAISMVPRTDGREGYVARVDPAKCVSCGICIASCAPMGVGPPGRTGRDQLAAVRAFIEEHRPGPEDVVLVACTQGPTSGATYLGAPVYHVSCAGTLHTSVVEYLVRAGTGGVLIATCPPRDCWNREGVAWMEERLYHGREAELKDRVDRRRIRVVHTAEAEGGLLAAELLAFRDHVQSMRSGTPEPEEEIVIDTECEVPEVSVAEEPPAGRGVRR